MLLTALGITVVGGVLVLWRLRVEARMGPTRQGAWEDEEEGDEEAGFHGSDQAETTTEHQRFDVGTRQSGRVTGAPAGYMEGARRPPHQRAPHPVPVNGHQSGSDGSGTPTSAAGLQNARQQRPASQQQRRSSVDTPGEGIGLVRTASQGGRVGAGSQHPESGGSAPARDQSVSLLD
jgi:hypothetical protein